MESALASLKMDGTRFRVGFEWEEAEEGEGIQVDGDAVGEEGTEFEPTSAGFDRVSFLMSAGPRDPFRRALSAVDDGSMVEAERWLRLNGSRTSGEVC